MMGSGGALARMLVWSSLAAAVAAGGACGPRVRALPTVPSPAFPPMPIMAASRLDAAQLAAWFGSRQSRAPGVYAASVPVGELTAIYVEEGRAEGVTGDVAFVQAIVETGWFRFGGAVRPWMNNFAGIGATDARGAPAAFPDARTGVRAQIQHLRAYADPRATTCTAPPLAFPCADPRFHLVTPKGRASTWNQLGGGNWATAPTYAAAILNLYVESLAFARAGSG
jgi:hypothetical protein